MEVEHHPKWKETNYLEGAIFHGTMIMVVEGYTEYRNKQNTEKTHTVSRYEFTTLFTFSSFGKWSVTVPLTLPSATSSSGNSTWCKQLSQKKYVGWFLTHPNVVKRIPKTLVFRAIRQSHSINRRQGGLPRVPSSISNGRTPRVPETLRVCRIARAIATYVGNGSVC